MSAWILWLLGGGSTIANRAGEDFHVVSIRWAGVRGVPLVVTCAAMVLAIALGLYLYARCRSISPARQRTLGLLRGGLLGLLIALATLPALRLTTETLPRRTIAVVTDVSPSMGLVASSSATVNRLAELQTAWAMKAADLNGRLREAGNVRYFSSGGGELAAQPDMAAMKLAVAGGSALGDDLSSAIDHAANDSSGGTAAAVLMSDGQDNAGAGLAAAAIRARQMRVPVFVCAVGEVEPRDLAVTEVSCPEYAFPGDEVAVVASVRAGGFRDGPITSRMHLLEDDREVATGDLLIAVTGRAGTQPSDPQIQEVTLRFKPEKPTPGGRPSRFSIRVDPLPGEITTTNNSLAVRLKVLDGKLRVLYIEAQPRWEYKYLTAILLRDTRLTTRLILTGRKARAGETDADSPYLAEWPTDLKALDAYDTVIWGDVDPASAPAGFADALQQWVTRRSGGLILLAGQGATPSAWLAPSVDARFRRLVPVEAATAGDRALTVSTDDPTSGDTPIQLALTAIGKTFPMLRLDQTLIESDRLWVSLPPVYWVAPAVRAKAGALVLVSARPAVGSVDVPVVVDTPAGLGRVLYVGTDNLWRWRRGVGDKYHGRLWGQFVQRMALAHRAGGSSRIRWSAPTDEVSPGEQVRLSAELLDQNYSARTTPMIAAHFRREGAPAAEAALALTLRALRDQPGQYSADFAAPPVKGQYRLQVDDDTVPSADADPSLIEPAPPPKLLTVRESDAELRHPQMNLGALKELADSNGGAVLYPKDLSTLPALLKHVGKPVAINHMLPIWSSPLAMLVVVGLAATEWALRKRWGLA